MERQGQTATAAPPLAEQLGRVGLWTRQLDIQPADQLRTTLVELEKLGWRSLWTWEVFGREALTNAGLLLCATQQLTVGTTHGSAHRSSPPNAIVHAGADGGWVVCLVSC